jgi:hypothetical protein
MRPRTRNLLLGGRRTALTNTRTLATRRCRGAHGQHEDLGLSLQGPRLNYGQPANSRPRPILESEPATNPPVVR